MSSIAQDASTALPPARTDSPLALRHIPFTFDTTEPEKSALELVQEYSKSWKEDEGEVVFKRFTDGITNTLMKATKRRPGLSDIQVDEDAILMRAYGKGTDVIIDRERELRAHNQLASFGLAPPLLARFNNGLMYKFIPGKVCSYEDLHEPEIYRQVAKRLAQWHATLPLTAIAAIPMLDAKAPNEQQHTPQNGQSTRPYPNTWTVLQQWIDALPENSEKERERKRTLDVECVEMTAKLGDTPGLNGKNYVFAHHDLLCGNVIVDTTVEGDEKPVSFIDYEYAAPGPQAFDIANHLAEWAGYDCVHSAVPTRSQRREFIENYVASFHHHSIQYDGEVTRHVDLERDVNQMYEQVELFRGMPGFFWGVWALIQAQISQIDFDYASYAELRLSEYWAWKEEHDGTRQREGREMHVREKKWQSE